MPKIRSLTPLQRETLGAIVRGAITKGRRRTFTSGKSYLCFELPNGIDVTPKVIALRKRGLVKWVATETIGITDKGILEWEQPDSSLVSS
jgi:hypothetical protein